MNLNLLLPVLPFGVLPLCFGIGMRLKELAPRKWLQIEGKIVNSSIVKERIRYGYQYVPVVEYEYSYNGETYNSSKRSAGNYVSGGTYDAEAIRSLYPTGSKVKVFINPEDPIDSVLEFGTSPISTVFIILGLGFTALGIMSSIIG